MKNGALLFWKYFKAETTPSLVNWHTTVRSEGSKEVWARAPFCGRVWPYIIFCVDGIVDFPEPSPLRLSSPITQWRREVGKLNRLLLGSTKVPLFASGGRIEGTFLWISCSWGLRKFLKGWLNVKAMSQYWVCCSHFLLLSLTPFVPNEAFCFTISWHEFLKGKMWDALGLLPRAGPKMRRLSEEAAHSPRIASVFIAFSLETKWLSRNLLQGERLDKGLFQPLLPGKCLLLP